MHCEAIKSLVIWTISMQVIELKVFEVEKMVLVQLQ